jgi:WXG100 family type VII secretion target
MAQVQINYDAMQSTAAQINGYAQQVKDAIRELQGDINQLTPTWDGAARKAFDESYAASTKELSHYPAMLEQLHSALLFAAETMRKAEDASTAATPQIVTSDRS